MRHLKGLRWLIIAYLVFLFCYETGKEFQSLLNPVSSEPYHKIILLKRGMSFLDVASLLEKEGLIRSKSAFVLLAFFRQATDRIKAGEYQFSPSQKTAEILDDLVKGKVVQYLAIIPEGYNKYEIAELLESINLVKAADFLKAISDQQVMRTIGIQAQAAEGYLFPDSYFFTRDATPEKIIKVMTGRFQEIWNVNGFEDRAKELGVSRHEIVTLASIVEKEAMIEMERPLIAAVFWNRLKRAMPLQADPTVIYGMLEETRGINMILKASDLKKDGPYNTYTNKGLPGGPICNPGSESIRAVLNPSKTDYLYFVSKRDGSHHFSDTLAEHTKAINQYLKNKTPNQLTAKDGNATQENR